MGATDSLPGATPVRSEAGSPSPVVASVLAGGGKMGARMRATDWAETPLGPVEGWPQSLRTSVSTCLDSRFPIVVWWGDELVKIYNDAYAPILGEKHPRALGRRGREVWPEIWHIIGPMLEGVLARGEATWSEDQMLPIDRQGFVEEVYFTFSYSPIRVESGAVGGVFTAVTETTAKVLGERRLRALQAITARSSDATTATQACSLSASALAPFAADVPFLLLYLTDADGKTARLASSEGLDRSSTALAGAIDLSGARPGAWPLGGLPADGAPLVVGLDEGIGPVPAGPWPEPCRQAVVMRLSRPGQEVPYGYAVAGVSPRLTLDDRYTGFFSLLADQLTGAISRARALEDERARVERLAELDRAKTTFFSNVSHEFRTPLTLLLGPTEDALASPERALRGEGLETVRRNGLRLLRLVNSLLDFSRIEAGRLQAVFEPTDLTTLTADLASSFRATIERAGLSFVVDCPKVPERVFVDLGMWEQIVLNLLSNAFKFTFDGQVRVALRDTGCGAALEVSDTGIGVEPHELGRLFERFHRVQGARSRSHEGSGIGLSLVHELVKLHGGSIEVESEPGRGTRFTVVVPYGSGHLPADQTLAGPSREGAREPRAGVTAFVEEAARWAAPPPGLAAARPAGAARKSAPSPRAQVLLVEDSVDMRDYVRRILEPHFDVVEARNGLEALAHVRARVPDAVLSDVMMPGLDGFGLLRALRDDPATATVPFVLLSARAGEEARIEGLEAGADEYLIKPFSAKELLARVGSQVELGSARSAVRASQARLGELFSKAPIALAVVAGDELRFEMANARYEQMLGRTGVVGRTVAEAFPELPASEPVFHMLRTVLATGRPFVADEYPVKLDRKGRGQIEQAYFLLVCQPLGGERGPAPRLVIVAVDVTAYVRARHRLELQSAELGELAAEKSRLYELARRERQRAEEASRAKDEFLATVSHELRTPLNAILGWTSLLREGSVPEAGRGKALETIERNTRSLVTLIEDVLDVSRIITGKLKLSMGEVSMARVVEAALETVRPAAEAKGVRLVAALGGAEAAVTGDEGRLQQVVWNLLSNAVKFTPRGGQVRVELSGEGGAVELRVADTGEGIAPSLLPQVFDRFWQADASSTRRHGGLGLGLAIVRHLVEQHGGSVGVASDGKGTGATFVVCLPVAGPAQPLAGSGPGAAASLSSSPLLEGLSVLVVDDERDTRELLETVLAQRKARVALASSAEQALALIAELRPDVLVSDVGMPGGDGYALIASVRALPRGNGGETPAIALTAYARDEDRQRALSAGFDGYLAKPVEPLELVSAVVRLRGRAPRP